MAANNVSPFPYSAIESSGMGFAMGLMGGGLYNFLKGPTGLRALNVAMNAPRTAGSWAVWGGLFETMSSGLAHVRHKEDPWNSIWAGGLTAGLLSLRLGPRRASAQFFVGAALLAGMEGVMIMLPRTMAISTDALEKEEEREWLRQKYGVQDDSKYGGDTSPPSVPNFQYK
ncbi:hypothetical protein vseg_000570 [Gypsophila vaccaria]